MKDKGSAVIELALVIPFFLIMIIGVTDISFTIQKNQYLSLVVREAGNSAYRQCRRMSSEDTEECLTNSAKESVSFINNSGGVIGGADLIVRSWTVDKGESNILKGEYKNGSFESKITEDRVKKFNSYDEELRQTLITVEIYLENTNNVPFFKRNLYEVMVF